jgi:hypothetical protein
MPATKIKMHVWKWGRSRWGAPPDEGTTRSTVPQWRAKPQVIATLNPGDYVQVGLPRKDGRLTIWVMVWTKTMGSRREAMTMAEWIDLDEVGTPIAQPIAESRYDLDIDVDP